jgi:glycosyltransferase involved in cell wall biosynthesis
MFALTHTEPAGAQQLWADLAMGFAARGHAVSLAAVYPHAKGSLELTGSLTWDLALARPPSSKAAGHEAVRGVFRILQAARPDVVFTALPAANVLFAATNLVRWRPCRLFLSHHSPVETHSRVLDGLDSLIARAGTVRKVICVSQAVRASLLHKPRAYRAKATVIKNALPLWVERHIGGLNLGAEDRASRPGRKIVACGRLAPQKNFPVLIRSLAALEDASLEIVGGGPDEGALRALVASLGLERRVTLLGVRSREETLAIVSQADIFAQPSLFEGHSLALVEAAKLGLPLVVSSVPSQVEGATRRDGTLCALTHEPDDHVGLAHCLARLLDDKAMRAAYRSLAETLADEIHFADMLDAYEQLALSEMPTVRGD